MDTGMSRVGHQAGFQREAREAGDAVNLELSHQTFAMRLDGAATDAQLGRDRFVGETPRHAAQHIAFPGRQLLDLQLRRRYGRRLRRGETLHHGRTEERAARVDCVNSGAQFFPRRIFQQLPMRANAHAFAHILALIMHTE